MELINKPLQTISLFELDKAGREEFIVQLVEAMDAGQVEPILVHLQVKGMEKIIDNLTETDEKKNPLALQAKRYKSLVLESVKTYGNKDVQFKNGKFDIKEVGVKYDYSQCNDPELAEWSTQASELAEKIKAKQKFLQTIPQKGLLVTNEETGETNTIYPPSRSSTTSVQCTIK